MVVRISWCVSNGQYLGHFNSFNGKHFKSWSIASHRSMSIFKFDTIEVATRSTEKLGVEALQFLERWRQGSDNFPPSSSFLFQVTVVQSLASIPGYFAPNSHWSLSLPSPDCSQVINQADCSFSGLGQLIVSYVVNSKFGQILVRNVNSDQLS